MTSKCPSFVSAEGLAVGLGIGAIAEVAKQSLGGKQKGGKDRFTAPPFDGRQLTLTSF